MRLAILSDIHGNPIALDAVLADVKRAGGVDGYWLLGDYAAIGPDPVGVIERVRALSNAQCIRGNTDRYATTQSVPENWVEKSRARPDEVEALMNVARSMAWTMGAVTAAGALGWLAGLPLEMRMTLPDGARVLGVHAAPGTDDGDGIRPTMSDDVLRAAVAGCEADLVLVGHTHIPLDRTVDGVRIFNPGSVSNALVADLRAKYAILSADATGHTIESRRVDYDREAVLALTEKVRHPAAERIVQLMRGEQAT